MVCSALCTMLVTLTLAGTAASFAAGYRHAKPSCRDVYKRQRLNCVTVLAPAKLNLALDVVGLLPSGYHDLDMTMPVSYTHRCV